MPDFNAQGPQEPNTLNSRLRTVLVANWVRIVLVSLGLFFFVMVVVPGGLLIYEYSGIGDKQPAEQQDEFLFPETVTCSNLYLDWIERKRPVCHAPKWDHPVQVCKADSRDEVNGQTPCRTPYSPLFCHEGFCYNTRLDCLNGATEGLGSGEEPAPCRRADFLDQLRAQISWEIWKALP